MYDYRGPQVFKSMHFFSLPPLVSKCSAHIRELISQIVQKRPKSGLRVGHSEVANSRHVVWTDSIQIEPNKFPLVDYYIGNAHDLTRM